MKKKINEIIKSYTIFRSNNNIIFYAILYAKKERNNVRKQTAHTAMATQISCCYVYFFLLPEKSKDM